MVFSLALKCDRVEQCLRSGGSEFLMWGPKQEKVLFIARFEYPPKWCTYSAVWLHVAGATSNCCRLGAFCEHYWAVQ